jgi:hypothetical protein
VIVVGVLFIFGNYWYSLIGIAIYQLFIILDCSDGDVSRYTHGVNKNARGAFLEYYGHSLFQPYMITCITFGLYNNPQSLFLGSFFYQNPVVFIIGFIGSNFYLALHVLDRLSKPDSSQTVSDEASTPSEAKRGLLGYPPIILSRFRELIKEYDLADPLLLVTTVSNTLWLYLIIWGVIQFFLVLVNSLAFYRGLPRPKVVE